MLSILKRKNRITYEKLDTVVKQQLEIELKKSIMVHASNLECYSIDLQDYSTAKLNVNNELLYVDNIPIKVFIQLIKDCTKRPFIVYTHVEGMVILHYSICFVQNMEVYEPVVHHIEEENKT